MTGPKALHATIANISRLLRAAGKLKHETKPASITGQPWTNSPFITVNGFVIERRNVSAYDTAPYCVMCHDPHKSPEAVYAELQAYADILRPRFVVEVVQIGKDLHAVAVTVRRTQN